MGWQPIPVEHDIPGDLPGDLVQELQHFATVDRLPGVEAEVEVAGGRDHADGADLGPVVRVGQDGRHSAWRPGPVDEGGGVEAAFVPEPDGDATRC